MADTAPLWQVVLGLVGFASFVIVPVLAVRWARRRRLRGEEAAGYSAEGAEAIVHHHLPH